MWIGSRCWNNLCKWIVGIVWFSAVKIIAGNEKPGAMIFIEMSCILVAMELNLIVGIFVNCINYDIFTSYEVSLMWISKFQFVKKKIILHLSIVGSSSAISDVYVLRCEK